MNMARVRKSLKKLCGVMAFSWGGLKFGGNLEIARLLIIYCKIKKIPAIAKRRNENATIAIAQVLVIYRVAVAGKAGVAEEA